MTTTSFTAHQTARPQGLPSPDDFTLVRGPVPEPAPGTALVRSSACRGAATRGRC
ncbi:hypothetical protein [Streptomyces sp. NPDC059994]|uniref:hypothetical protein n=1 Tax=Streptomyces sp. NPDC059994 TaxID=3347029 RepID=UPI003683C8C9